MSFDVPEDRNYLESHEWTTLEEDTVTVGITDFAQDELGDVVFVELPSEGDTVTAGDTFGVIESIKAVSDLYAPVSGEVTAVNEALFDQPELVNDDPFGDGWMLKINVSDDDTSDSLLTAAEYADQIA
ncbi:glycine cleavage system protein GcvH [Natronocalculus amylovorans]|uniref:Probable glycine cleavage system H protein n=1 Tax=Natronocalculus amylovorans TaxID=2917812 RepID=A0AAE3FW42_9EURY|nr:glycine cleavage system protein GcvH [Natronocalculus amylovorans]MCL9816316.1 glycine cleavage system protein GcvH [Natronocalculus amylovorans]NUE03406.1 glycine cleavage system protein GcvH [Halorubraceae archaeon YAN]